jgi:hypothetical protein
MISEADIFTYELYVGADLINKISGTKIATDLKLSCFFSIKDGKKRTAYKILKSKLNFKNLFDENTKNSD